MKLLRLTIEGFRGIQQTKIEFGLHDVIIGPNGSGKSTIVDALSLVFGRTRFVRDLTEHDFYGTCPGPASRIRIIATLGGFVGNDPEHHDIWFREGRAVPKWFNFQTGAIEAEQSDVAQDLCAQIGFAARFDVEELVVDQVRYFHDDDSILDPFLDETIQQVPFRLFDDIGYYVLPARRTWEATASFASELFRKAVATVGGVPAQTILDERDRLRRPPFPLETDPALAPLVERINAQLARLLPQAPKFQLRVTATDSDSLLRALISHYQSSDGITLPVSRHGMGLLSLQTFILLLELGRERRRQGKPFILAMEEPELHIPPGIQRRLVAQAVSIAEQTICTTHSPRVAGWYPATSVKVLDQRSTELTCISLLSRPLDTSASNAVRKFYYDERPRVIEALMQYRVLIPEGRSEYEWFRLLADVLETGTAVVELADQNVPPFGTVIGVIPTHDSAVTETFVRLRRLRSGLVLLVDGDSAGNAKVEELLAEVPAPDGIFQWRDGWMIEDVIGWILKGDANEALQELRNRIDREFTDIDDLMALFKTRTGGRRLKTDYLAYEEVASVIGCIAGCRQRGEALLSAVTQACLGWHDGCSLITHDVQRSTEQCLVLRLSP